ncbi:hypothetical protein ABW19_dt0206036 [Dactylella cylindrospora]|nr:hypothetical protein ABW19_dt0206036 [Dactylella cylindrospora]
MVAGALARSFSRSNKFEVVDGVMRLKQAVGSRKVGGTFRSTNVLPKALTNPAKPLPQSQLRPKRTPASRSKRPSVLEAVKQIPVVFKGIQKEDPIHHPQASTTETSEERFERAWDLMLQNFNEPARKGIQKVEGLSFGVGEGLSVMKRMRLFKYLCKVEAGEPPLSDNMSSEKIAHGSDYLPVGAEYWQWKEIPREFLLPAEGSTSNSEAALDRCLLHACRINPPKKQKLIAPLPPFLSFPPVPSAARPVPEPEKRQAASRCIALASGENFTNACKVSSVKRAFKVPTGFKMSEKESGQLRRAKPSMSRIPKPKSTSNSRAYMLRQVIMSGNTKKTSWLLVKD